MTNAPPNFALVVAVSALHALGGALCANELCSHRLCDAWRLFSRVCLVGFMLGAASLRMNRKLVEKLLVPIVPPPLPPRLCVYASGAMDVTSAMLLARLHDDQARWLIYAVLREHTRIAALLTMLVCVFPANLYHAFSRKAHAATGIGPPAVYWRLPIQFLFLAWARWHVT